ncbi:MAG: exodeoxyribonuclease VII small subunit [Clostridia bacterium]|nr:exodeoxyribonuclease VII small subunit [Clostridia bacterium]
MEEIKFEAALERLEEIVRTLESGHSSLEDSMKYYEEGVKLVRICTGKLENARKKVLTVSENGTEEEK